MSRSFGLFGTHEAHVPPNAGPDGGMHFYFFKVQDEDGKTAIDEYQEGSFTIKHSDKEFSYTLPLVALMPGKKCPVDHAEMKGNWKYCPFHGDLLKE